MRALLVGNYGVGNFGDDALKEVMLRAFPEVSWTALSEHPSAGELPRLPGGLRSLLDLRWIRTLHALRRADALVFGGGTLFTDIESWRACLLWGIHAAAAYICRVPIILAFQGIGPFKTRRGESLARWVVARAAYCSVRDEESAQRINSWRKITNVVQTFDPVFFSSGKHNSISREKNVFIVIPRHNSGNSFLELCRRVRDAHPEGSVRILSFQPDDPGERSAVTSLRSALGGGESVAITTIDQVLDELSRAHAVVTHRFHGALAAMAAGIRPVICAQGKGDKLDALDALLEREGSAAVARMHALAEEGVRTLREVLRALHER